MLALQYFRDGGGYYIDVGASTLIAEKKIKLKQGQEIVKVIRSVFSREVHRSRRSSQLTKDGVLFADGVELKVSGSSKTHRLRHSLTESQADIVV